MQLEDLLTKWQSWKSKISVDSAADSGIDNGADNKVTTGLVLTGCYLVVTIALGCYWSVTPDSFDVRENTALMLAAQQHSAVDGVAVKPVVGSMTTSVLIRVAEILLDKPGGYLSNDVFPPGAWLDNVPNWEYGVLIQLRDLSRAMRENFSRSQSQSTEDVDLIVAEPRFNFANDSWAIPASESEYRDAIAALKSYLARISNAQNQHAQFYARADNLSRWLLNVETRLGSLSQRLTASVGQKRINTDLLGEGASAQSTPMALELEVKTPWREIDDIFYEARGATWALMHFLKAVEVDFHDILVKKNALVSLRQIIRELEACQQTIFSPIILNGSGFGLLANHSLVIASFVSRANAAIIDLRALLMQG